jgi:hypothetical protein
MRSLALALLLPVAALARPPAVRAAPPAAKGPAPAASAVVRFPACAPLPSPRAPFAFRPGEELDFSLDAMGAQAGRMSLKVLPEKDGVLAIRADAKSNTFFSKIRKVRGSATSFLDARTLHPRRYVEDSTENDVHRTADVHFSRHPRLVKIDYTINGKPGRRAFRSAPDALDAASSIFLLRQLPLHQGQSLCFDSYGIRRLWRVTAKVVAREHVSLPLGEFDAWHIAGEAVRTDAPTQRREMHVWISDDARRLPLVAVGSIDLGAVRATLTRFARPGEKPQSVHAEAARDLTW